MSKVYNTRKLQIFVLCQFMAKEYNFYYCGTVLLVMMMAHTSHLKKL